MFQPCPRNQHSAQNVANRVVTLQQCEANRAVTRGGAHARRAVAAAERRRTLPSHAAERRAKRRRALEIVRVCGFHARGERLDLASAPAGSIFRGP
jgi:hypothetical protein